MAGLSGRNVEKIAAIKATSSRRTMRIATRRLKEIIKKKSKGQKIEKVDHEEPTNVVNLMDALRASVKGGGTASSERRKPARTGTGKKSGRVKTRSRKAS